MKHVAIISKENDKKEIEYLLIKAKRDFGEFTGFWYPPVDILKKGSLRK